MYALAAALYRLSFRGLYPELHVRPDRCAAAGAVGENSRDDPNFHFTQYRGSFDLARSRRAVRLTVKALKRYIASRISIRELPFMNWALDVGR